MLGALRANILWFDSLDHADAFQMGYVRRLFESYPFQELIPGQDLIVDGPAWGGRKSGLPGRELVYNQGPEKKLPYFLKNRLTKSVT